MSSGPLHSIIRIDARSQFVALGAGAIVGRCGASSPARHLPPECLAQIGRRWVVRPSHQVTVDLDQDTTPARTLIHRIVVLSKSPTLGVVAGPKLAFRGEFVGWAGEGHRVCVYKSHIGLWVTTLVVRDLTGDSGLKETELTRIASYDKVLCNRMWIVITVSQGIALWNVDTLGSNTRPDILLTIPRADKLEFIDDNTLAYISNGTLYILDLIASCATASPACIFDRNVNMQKPSKMWCFDNKVYLFGSLGDSADPSMICGTTGEKIITVSHVNCEIDYVGYCYFYIKTVTDSSTETTYYDLRDPRHALCTFFGTPGTRIRITNEVMIQHTSVLEMNQYKVCDAIRGTEILTINTLTSEDHMWDKFGS